jgi:hypothetical protein
MVFGYGAGTGQLIQSEEPASTGFSTTGSSLVESSFTEKENGGWNWQINETAVSDLISNFHWLEQTVNELKPEIQQGTLRLQASENPNFFVTHEDYKNVQMDAYLNVENLAGEIRLAHHIRDTQNYDFVSLNSDGTIRQGRIQDGETTIFEEGSFQPKGALYLRLVADDTHFRGYIDREMKVHGHGDAPKQGAVGIRLEGSGNVQISSIELTTIN